METSSTTHGSSDPASLQKVHHTPSGKPYIILDTNCSTPIYLTPFYNTDVTTLQATVSIPAIATELISVPQPYTIDSAQFWIDLQLSGKCNLPLQVIRSSDPESGQLIGSASLMPLDSDGMEKLRSKLPKAKGKMIGNEHELGYYLHPEWRGKGIMTAVVRALVEWGKAEYGAVTVIRVAEQNTQSRKVVERFEKFTRDETRDDWVDWPVEKGGGRRKLLFWKWQD
jgi:RimJ/RimL family protein N-acetyltransferase